MNTLAENLNLQNRNKPNQLTDTNNSVFQILKKSKFDNISDYLTSLNEWITYNSETIKAFFIKYPHISEENFKKIFLTWDYNKNILMQNHQVLDLFDFNEIKPWTDLIEIFIQKIWISDNDFKKKLEKLDIDFITFPWLAKANIAQENFYNKLVKKLKKTKVFFWDDKIAKLHYWVNQISVNTIWFWWINQNLFNTNILKLIQTEADEKKLSEIEKIFENIENNIFIWWSTDWIPFSTKNTQTQNIIFSREESNKLCIELDWMRLKNSMWYLNSAYYSKKVIWAFVWWDHNLMESLHAGKLTINNKIENRTNHNWLISYLGEKFWLLLFIDSKLNFKDNQDKIDEFLNMHTKEVEKKVMKLFKSINWDINNFINWIIINILETNKKEGKIY